MWIFQPIASIYFCSCIHTNAIFVCKRNRKSSLWVHSSIDEHSDNIDTDTCIYKKTWCGLHRCESCLQNITKSNACIEWIWWIWCYYHPHTRWNVVNCVDNVKVPQHISSPFDESFGHHIINIQTHTLTYESVCCVHYTLCGSFSNTSETTYVFNVM